MANSAFDFSLPKILPKTITKPPTSSARAKDAIANNFVTSFMSGAQAFQQGGIPGLLQNNRNQFLASPPTSPLYQNRGNFSPVANSQAVTNYTPTVRTGGVTRAQFGPGPGGQAQYEAALRQQSFAGASRGAPGAATSTPSIQPGQATAGRVPGSAMASEAQKRMESWNRYQQSVTRQGQNREIMVNGKPYIIAGGQDNMRGAAGNDYRTMLQWSASRGNLPGQITKVELQNLQGDTPKIQLDKRTNTAIENAGYTEGFNPNTGEFLGLFLPGRVPGVYLPGAGSGSGGRGGGGWGYGGGGSGSKANWNYGAVLWRI